jgi:hypothetical protein
MIKESFWTPACAGAPAMDNKPSNRLEKISLIMYESPPTQIKRLFNKYESHSH